MFAGVSISGEDLQGFFWRDETVLSLDCCCLQELFM